MLHNMPQASAASSSMLTNLRDGDMAEYLAQFMLSNLGASILTPRPEDHGFDFHCTINAAERNKPPEFKDSFYLQTKLGDPKEIEVGGNTSGGRWRRGQIHRVLNMDIPLLMGFVDVTRHQITIFQTSARWMLYYELITGRRPFKIIFRPSPSISKPASRKARSVNPTKEHDGKRWSVDLGPPLLRMRLHKLRDGKTIRAIKRTLTDYIEMERRSAAHRILCTQWALWICKPARRGMPFDQAWVIEREKFPKRDAAFYREFGMALVSLIFRLHAQKQNTALREASAIYRRLEPKFTISLGIRALVAQVLV